MKVLCLGGAGRISRESVHDLVEFSDFKTITIGDFNEQAGREVVAWLNNPRVDFRKVDIHDHAATVHIMQDYDIVMDGTTISLNDRSTACIAEAGVHGINLNGFGDEYKYDSIFKRFGKVHVPGFGMTPGITDMMAKYARSKSGSVWFYIIPEGMTQDVVLNFIDTNDAYDGHPRQVGLVLNPFTAQFKEYDEFQKP